MLLPIVHLYRDLKTAFRRKKPIKSERSGALQKYKKLTDGYKKPLISVIFFPKGCATKY